MLRKVWLPLPLLLLLACPVRPGPSQSGEAGQSKASDPIEAAELDAHPALKKLPSLLRSMKGICAGPVQADEFLEALRITKMKYENIHQQLLDALRMHRRECEEVWLKEFADFKSRSPKKWLDILDVCHHRRETSRFPQETFGERMAVGSLISRIPFEPEQKHEMLSKAVQLRAEVVGACSVFKSALGPYIEATQKLKEEGTDFYNNNVPLWVEYWVECLPDCNRWWIR